MGKTRKGKVREKDSVAGKGREKEAREMCIYDRLVFYILVCNIYSYFLLNVFIFAFEDHKISFLNI